MRPLSHGANAPGISPLSRPLGPPDTMLDCCPTVAVFLTTQKEIVFALRCKGMQRKKDFINEGGEMIVASVPATRTSDASCHAPIAFNAAASRLDWPMSALRFATARWLRPLRLMIALLVTGMIAACSNAPVIPSPADQPLSKEALMLLGRKSMTADAPIHIRIFKEEIRARSLEATQ